MCKHYLLLYKSRESKINGLKFHLLLNSQHYQYNLINNSVWALIQFLHKLITVYCIESIGMIDINRLPGRQTDIKLQQMRWRLGTNKLQGAIFFLKMENVAKILKSIILTEKGFVRPWFTDMHL